MGNLIVSGLTTGYNAIPDEKKKQFIDWIKRSTGGAVDSIQSAVQYAKKSEAPATVVAEGLVRFGAPAEVVAGVFKNTANAELIRNNLLSLGRNLIAQEDASRPGLNASVSDTSNDVMRAELIKSLVRAFGSVENARKVQMALATLREADFAWYSAIQPVIR